MHKSEGKLKFEVFTGEGFNIYIPDDEKDIEFFPYDYTRVEPRLKGEDWSYRSGEEEHWVNAVTR